MSMYNPSGRICNTDNLLRENSELVKKIAYQFKSKLPASVEVDDLIQAGMIGLLDAIGKFETTHGAQFHTYASQRIQGAILDELRNSDWLPRGMRKTMRDIEKAIQVLEQKLGYPPNEAAVAKKLNMSIAEYQKVLGDCSGHNLVYFEDFHAEEDSEHFLDRHVQSNKGDALQALLSKGFKKALIDSITALPEREMTLMGLYYEQNLNLKEIGLVIDLSESRISQIHTQAVARLRASLRNKFWTEPE